MFGSTQQEKADVHGRSSASLFTFWAGIEALRAGSTLPHFFINHSMPVSIHPSIHGPCENTGAPRAPAVADLRATTTTWCCRNGRIPGIPPNRLCESLCQDGERVKPNKKKRGEVQKVVRPVKNEERWAGILEMQRGGEERGGKGKERKWGTRGMTARRGRPTSTACSYICNRL